MSRSITEKSSCSPRMRFQGPAIQWCVCALTSSALAASQVSSTSNVHASRDPIVLPVVGSTSGGRMTSLCGQFKSSMNCLSAVAASGCGAVPRGGVARLPT